MTEHDPVNHPSHYTQYQNEVIELTEQLDFCLGNAVKYILRAPFKGNEIQDLEKARWYLFRWKENHKQNGACFDAGMLRLAQSYDNELLNSLFGGATIYTSVDNTIDDINDYIRDLEVEKLEKDNERLKGELAKARMELELTRQARVMQMADLVDRLPDKDIFGAWIVR